MLFKLKAPLAMLALIIVFAAQESESGIFDFLPKLKLPKLKLPKLKLPGIPILSDIPDLLKIIKQAQDTMKNPQRGKWSYNESFYEDIIHTCENLRQINKDFGFYSTEKLCPNITDLLETSMGFAQSGVDVLVEVAVAAITLLRDKSNCDAAADNQLAMIRCYSKLVVPALKEVNILMFSAKDLMAALRSVSQGILADWDFCKTYSNLTAAERQKYVNAWKNDKETCEHRAQTIVNRTIINLGKGPEVKSKA